MFCFVGLKCQKCCDLHAFLRGKICFVDIGPCKRFDIFQLWCCVVLRWFVLCCLAVLCHAVLASFPCDTGYVGFPGWVSPNLKSRSLPPARGSNCCLLFMPIFILLFIDFFCPLSMPNCFFCLLSKEGRNESTAPF